MKNMKFIILYFSLLFLTKNSVRAQDTLFIEEPQIPILTDCSDNVLYRLRIDNSSGNIRTFNGITILLNKAGINKNIKSAKLYYAGTEALQNGKTRMAPVNYMSGYSTGNTRKANASYSLLLTETKHPDTNIPLLCHKELYPGVNYFWISMEIRKNTPLETTFQTSIQNAYADGKELKLFYTGEKNKIRRLALGLRHTGDDGSAAFRIPGLVTSRHGTLLSVYDIRHNNSADLQEHVEIGLSRSVNGGKTWEKMRTILSFANEGGLPSAQNGVGDPSILVDEKTGTIWVIAAWTHGMGNSRAWWSSHDGMDKERTAQLVLTKSEDDGKTWSQPINITEQVKRPSWKFLLQGPGRGITMKDGTLVFPIQFIDSVQLPHAGIMYSTDHGKNWTIHQPARTNTTEAQVAEISPGILMLNMRDNRGGSRAVAITSDLGKTWTEHPSSRNALPEPVCMASLLQVDADKNITGRDILLFSNPDDTKSRKRITIKASLDKGLTWPKKYHLLLDEEEGWGYSCLTLIDNEHIGIVYEGSRAHLVFQKIKITDIITE